jgi:ATP-binding cassette subfamily B protein
VFQALQGYGLAVVGLLLLTMAVNAVNLSVPKVVSRALDQVTRGTFSLSAFALTFAVILVSTFVLSYGQSIAQVLLSERVARDLRAKLSARIAEQSYLGIQQLSPSTILTNFTSDVDAVKQFVSMGIPSLISSAFLLIAISALLLTTDWRLGLAVLAVLPILVAAFATIFGKVGPLFGRAQQSIDALNKVINESILGASLIRVLNASQKEADKFFEKNTEAKTVGMSILRLFASLIPIITFLSGMMILIILLYGGNLVIGGRMTLGEFTAFNSYSSLLVFPIMMMGFLSSMIGRASASYGRVVQLLQAPVIEESGTMARTIRGDVRLQDVSLSYGEKQVLRRVSFAVRAGSRVAIIGPTAAGKSQLLALMAGLILPTTGTIEMDGEPLASYQPAALRAQMGVVFQESLLFQGTLRENIAFSAVATEESIMQAVRVAELETFVRELPQGLDTPIAERAATLSGGQKQRLMLARALAGSPKVLLLDDFTARVDMQTEQRILKNIAEVYPELTIISVTQKVNAASAFDQVVLLMEGEVVANGSHDELMRSSPEYAQIVQSQQSLSSYESTH